eukprot:gene13624-19501_t
MGLAAALHGAAFQSAGNKLDATIAAQLRSVLQERMGHGAAFQSAASKLDATIAAQLETVFGMQ